MKKKKREKRVYRIRVLEIYETESACLDRIRVPGMGKNICYATLHYYNILVQNTEKLKVVINFHFNLWTGASTGFVSREARPILKVCLPNKGIKGYLFN